MNEITAVLFDKDGTLFDFASTWEAWAAAFLRRLTSDTAQAEALGKAIGFDLSQQQFELNSIVIAGTPGEVATALLSELPGWQYDGVLNLLNEEAEKAPQAEAVPLVPFLDQLRADGLVLGVVTNDAEAPARAHLDAAGVTDHFDFIAGFDSGHGAKPAPGQLLAFAKAVGMPSKHIIMVGDSSHDLIAAERAGMRGIGVLTGLATADMLADYAEVVLPDIGHLPTWIAAQRLS